MRPHEGHPYTLRTPCYPEQVAQPALFQVATLPASAAAACAAAKATPLPAATAAAQQMLALPAAAVAALKVLPLPPPAALQVLPLPLPAAVEMVLLRAVLVAELLPAMEVRPIAELQRAAVGVPVPVYVPQLLDLAAHL